MSFPTDPSNPRNSPSITPVTTFTCFSCSERAERPFAKIFRGTIIYHMCKSQCLTAALERLGLTDDNRAFTSPINISIQSPVSAFINPTRSPLQRSPGRLSLTKITDSDSDSESKMDIDTIQVSRLGKQLFEKENQDE